MKQNESLISLFIPFAFVGLRETIILLITAFIALYGCTTKAPNSDSSQTQPAHKTNKPEEQLLKTLAADKVALNKSTFVQLTHDAQALESWEKSDGWVMYYQGQLTKALEAFISEVKGPLSKQAEIGQARAHLELATTYHHIMEINQFLLPKWLEFERARPNSKIHHNWYNLIEYLAVFSEPSQKARSSELKQKLDADDTMSTWLSVLTGKSESFPDMPRVNPKYRKWDRFSKAIFGNEFSKATKLMKKLKLDAKITTSKGEGSIPSLTIYDPRLPKVMMTYHAQAVLQRCSEIEWGSYYCARAYEILGQKKEALEAFKAAADQLKSFTTTAVAPNQKNNPSINEIAHVLVTSHTSMAEFDQEIKTKIQQLSAASKKTTASTEKMTTSALLWQSMLYSKELPLPNLLPERRRALGILFNQALEEAKGKQMNYVASLGLNDRWLDELHYLYAIELVKRDQRVKALKVLNASEEAKSGSRLQGRNRLPRLLLSAYNQLKMGRQRVSSKYFQRLKEILPAISFSLMMTSDILSGTSFENNGSRVNAGQ